MYSYRLVQLLQSISAQTRICFPTLFCVERLRGYSPGAPNINVPPTPPFSVHLPRREEESRSRFLRPFFNFNPVHSFVSSLAYTRVLRFPPFRLSRGLFFLSTVDVSAYIVERRRINSWVLSDTIREDNGLLCFFPGGGTSPSGKALRAISRRLENGKGEKDGRKGEAVLRPSLAV